MKKSDEFVYVIGKEYAIAKFLFLIAVIIFIVPLIIIFLLRGIYKLF